MEIISIRIKKFDDSVDLSTIRDKFIKDPHHAGILLGVFDNYNNPLNKKALNLNPDYNWEIKTVNGFDYLIPHLRASDPNLKYILRDKT